MRRYGMVIRVAPGKLDEYKRLHAAGFGDELFAAELASVRTQADRYTQLVGVYQAVGGGWVDIAAEIAPKPQSAIPRRP